MMMSKVSTLAKVISAICLILTLITTTFAQVDSTAEPNENTVENQESLIEKLDISFFPPSPGAFALFPLSIVTVETPIAVRYALMSAVSAYQIFAACNPISLSFFGTKDPIDPSKLCDQLSRTIIFYQLSYRLALPEFPQEAAGIAQFMLGVGLNPFDNTANIDTPIGWANDNSIRLREYFDNDGWNSLGDESKTFYRFPFQDTSGYKPQNDPSTSPMDLPRPLRWQPLPFTDFKGRFGHHIHVVPHIGNNAKRLALSTEDFESRKAPSPYKFPNMSMGIDPADEETVRKRINDLFNQTLKLNDDRVALAYWWENKFVSLGSFIAYYQAVLGLDADFTIISGFGEMIAQHDAVLVAWKEKRRHDLVRPTTMIRRFLSGKMVNAYRGFRFGNGMISADEWEPLLQVQPHSEYPSASAVICAASLERLQADLEEIVGPNGTIPLYVTQIPPATIPGNPVKTTVTVRFETLKEAAFSCGESRLYGGVHFEPAVTEGFKLGEGIGKAAFEHAKDLIEGRVPKNCERCRST